MRNVIIITIITITRRIEGEMRNISIVTIIAIRIRREQEKRLIIR